MTLPLFDTPADEPVALAGAEVLQAVFEHAGSRGETFLPDGLVPTSPTLVTLLAVRVPGGPLGSFTMAQVRLSCRSGARARALAVATAVDAGPDVVAWLARWGIGGMAGVIAFDRRYDRVRVTSPWFDVEVSGPRPIGPADVQYVTGLHPVVMGSGERLVQVELDMVPERVERGRPVLHRFDAPDAALGLAPRWPVAGTSAVGTLTLPRVRFVLRPDQPAHIGTERVTHPEPSTTT